MVVHESLETKITSICDVLVCGGGFAGISAALAAARQGKKVILLERQYILGGLGTAAIMHQRRRKAEAHRRGRDRPPGHERGPGGSLHRFPPPVPGGQSHQSQCGLGLRQS